MREMIRERHLWHERIQTCKRQPDECMAIYLDGMDQDKTDIPRVANQNFKDLADPMKVRLIGGLLYRKEVHPYAFLFPGEKFPCDTNSNLECLRRILSSIGKEKLPPKLFIQLDNTCKDNKNYYFFRYCAYLVLAGYFVVIEIYFLPVGHTHGQIDQMFSRISVFLRRFPAKTLPELMYCLSQAYNNPTKKKAKKAKAENKVQDKEVTSVVIDSCVDVKTWTEDLIDNTQKRRMALSGSHAFQFQLNPTNPDEVLVRSKEWASDPVFLVLFFDI
jgi:hypothetical protein